MVFSWAVCHTFPLCRLVPATLVGPLWPFRGLLVQGTKPACLTRVTAALSHLCRPHSFYYFALFARPPAPLSSLAVVVGGGLRLPLDVCRYPIICAVVPNPLFSALVPLSGYSLFDSVGFYCVG
jgi:hypothetical protein